MVQCYWNYKNYKQNKQHFINNVQTSLDNALEDYYANLAEANHMSFIDLPSDTLRFHENHKALPTDSIILSIQNNLDTKLHGDLEYKEITQLIDSTAFSFSSSTDKLTQIKVIKGEKVSDSLKLLKGITSIFISIQDDSLNFSRLKPLINNELKRKNLNIPFALKHFRNDSVINTYNTNIITPRFLKTSSKTKFLKQNESLELAYANATRFILKEGFLGMLLSFILALAIVASLIYLLQIIKHQKQLAEVKNDLISNITHEFKTPIATIGVALESIKNFNAIQDKEKTNKYLNISTNQLTKLNTMVEKLLETATLDSESLQLDKQYYNVSNLMQSILDKQLLHAENKTIHFNFNPTKVEAYIDVFHFENAINNIIDNAIKYGGDTINVQLEQNKEALLINISDNGNTLTKANKEKIFEKFYRVPKGNIHNVKGFGIGLYYTKKIIEKHNGEIVLALNKNQTNFKITIPNA